MCCASLVSCMLMCVVLVVSVFRVCCAYVVSFLGLYVRCVCCLSRKLLLISVL